MDHSIVICLVKNIVSPKLEEFPDLVILRAVHIAGCSLYLLTVSNDYFALIAYLAGLHDYMQWLCLLDQFNREPAMTLL
jgi:hypothetical protein